jgi:hypothetical protein
MDPMPQTNVKYLWTAARWMVAALVCKVCYSIVANYVDYFPPNFEADFLIGRQPFFHGLYRVAFYMHILSAPVVLLTGLFLLNNQFRNRHLALHRIIGRIHVLLVLLLVTPSGIIMAQHSLAGWTSGIAFVLSSFLTALFTLLGWLMAVRRQMGSHRKWMLRSYTMLCSAVTLRLIGGAAILLETDPIASYRFAAWTSWGVPLAMLELFFLFRGQKTKSRSEGRNLHSKTSGDNESEAFRVPIAPQAPKVDDGFRSV